ncbi:hypothetical protein [Wocania ichthyoenteri]|uniref:hypothetical protein n=1 Tax=Wocania ichthyoenteri TaxID=1230531 RepID=UPI0012E01C85|nr:hypothetical protein [Wocania ichthyoenteri]
MKKIILSTTIITLLFISSINAQKGFRIEAGIGPTLGDSSEYFSYTLLGNFYYLWNVSENISIGPTTGVLVFLGEGKNINGSECLFCSVPDVYIPIAIAGRIGITKLFSLGTDIGYGLSANAFDDGGGLYFRPILTYSLKKKNLLLLVLTLTLMKMEEVLQL